LTEGRAALAAPPPRPPRCARPLSATSARLRADAISISAYRFIGTPPLHLARIWFLRTFGGTQ
jgi:hypothetical protein